MAPTAALTTQQYVQFLVVIVAIASIFMTAVFWRRHPDEWAYTIPPLSWLAHVLIFYAFVFAKDFLGLAIGLDFMLWSAVLRLQAAFLILGVMTMLAYEHLIFRGADVRA